MSITNFMPGGNAGYNNNGSVGNTSFGYNEGASDLFTMQDIDKISKELILPSLNMTKSSSFIPNHYSP